MKPIYNILYLTLLFLYSSFLGAQVNTDSLFNEALKSARNNEFEQATEQSKKVLNYLPNRHDVLIYTARLYAFQRQFDSAKVYINRAYKINQTDPELYSTWLNIHLWNKEYIAVLKTAELAEENNYPDTYDLILKRSLAYKSTNNYNTGIEYLDNNKSYLDSAKINAIYNEMLIKDRQKQISVFYSVDFYEKDIPAPRHWAYIDYSFKLKNNTLIPRLNYAKTSWDEGFMAEADYYHSFKNGNYAYFNYGAAIINTAFPKHRAGAEYYWSMRKQLEASFGGRYMYYPENHVGIITGHLGRYAGRYWLAFRPFYTIKTSGNSIVGLGQLRRYGKTSLNYWGLELGYGNSPDETGIIANTDYRLQSYRIKIEKSISFAKLNSLKLVGGYAYEEYIQDMFRNKFTIEVVFKHRL